MKIIIDKASFIKSWSLAERSAGSSGTMNIYATVKLRATDDAAEMQATDIKTSIICRAGGITVMEPGEAVIPLKGVSDLFKKAGSSEFELEVEDGRAVMKSGKSKYKFSTYPAGDFPRLPSSSAAALFCTVKLDSLVKIIESGSLCASVSDEYPQYLSSALFEMDGSTLKVVSTDKRRLALAKCETIERGEATEDLLLPMKGLRELTRILGMLGGDLEVKIAFDDSQGYFMTEGVEFAIRRVESKFPPYAKILPTSHTTRADVDKSHLLAALERVDIVVRDYNKKTVVSIDPNGDSTLSGRAPEFGEAVEDIVCETEGEPVLIGFNTKFFLDAVKTIDGDTVSLNFNGSDEKMQICAKGSDDFICLIAPVDISTEGPSGERSDDGGDVR